MFLTSFLNIFFCAFFCAFMYFFCAFCCLLFILRAARASDLALGAATAMFGSKKPKLSAAKVRIAVIRLIDFCGIPIILQQLVTCCSITEVNDSIALRSCFEVTLCLPKNAFSTQNCDLVQRSQATKFPLNALHYKVAIRESRTSVRGPALPKDGYHVAE